METDERLPARRWPNSNDHGLSREATLAGADSGKRESHNFLATVMEKVSDLLIP